MHRSTGNFGGWAMEVFYIPVVVVVLQVHTLVKIH